MLTGTRAFAITRSTLAALFALGCGGGVAATPPASAESPLLGRTVPDLRRVALDGSPVDLVALRGRVVVIEFFAEHCVPCAVALPAAEGAHRERPEAFFLGVSEDDDASGAARMVARHGVSFPVVHDAGNAVAGRLRVSELPATIVVDREGNVRWVSGNAARQSELVTVIDTAAAGRLNSHTAPGAGP